MIRLIKIFPETNDPQVLNPPPRRPPRRHHTRVTRQTPGRVEAANRAAPAPEGDPARPAPAERGTVGGRARTGGGGGETQEG